MRGLIILDGPDGAGKTTLAQEIVRQTGGHYIHLTYRFKDKMFLYHLAALHHAIKLSKDRFVVIDRLWMSELAYANAYRNGSKWPLMYRMLERLILKHAGLEVVCLPEHLGRHLHEYESLKMFREEMYTDISSVCIEYHKLWDKVKDWPHVRRYCVQMAKDTPGFLEQYAAVLIADQQEWQEEQLDWALEPERYNIAGHISPAKYLMVCGQNDTKRKGWYPFVAYHNAALHVAKVMEELGIPEHDCMWTCYYENKDETHTLIPTYDLKPYVFGSNTWHKWMEDMGGASQMRMDRLKGHKVLTMTWCNDCRAIVDPIYDVAQTKGKHFKCDLGSELLRSAAYGRTV